MTIDQNGSSDTSLVSALYHIQQGHELAMADIGVHFYPIMGARCMEIPRTRTELQVTNSGRHRIEPLRHFSLAIDAEFCAPHRGMGREGWTQRNGFTNSQAQIHIMSRVRKPPS
jgi:hypothetical protein